MSKTKQDSNIFKKWITDAWKRAKENNHRYRPFYIVNGVWYWGEYKLQDKKT